jgi:hypothetical protein
VFKALNSTQDLICNVQQYMPLVQQVSNSETMLATVYRHMNVSVKRNHLTMFNVRAAGDPSSWSVGDEHEELKHFGLKVKYAAELADAIAACGVSTITQHVDALKQHTVPVF